MSKILIVDDDVEICDTFTDILRHAGYDVHVVKRLECYVAWRPMSSSWT
jgi:DNA-binding response OmpR family regulator